MRVISGAGEFNIEFTRVIEQNRNIVLLGKMGYWETQLILGRREALGLARAMVLPFLRSFLRL